jgi:hypothetical protein
MIRILLREEGRRCLARMYDHEYIDIVIFLTAVGLSPGGSKHLHTSNTQNNTNNNKKTARYNNYCGRVRTVPRLYEFYPGICLTTEEKTRKNLSQGKRNLS